MVMSLGDSFGIDPDAFTASGALDPILGVDTRLFIDPTLLKRSKAPELKDSEERVFKYFSDVLRVLSFVKSEDDAFWRKANNLLTFPEVNGLCIGYSSNGIAGRGMGAVKRSRLLDTMLNLVRAGASDPKIFELVGAFEEGIGPDLVSDMIATIIIDDLVAYTQRVSDQLGLPVEEFRFDRSRDPALLPYNRTSKQPIILVPKDVLRDLPVADTYADIFWIARQNDALRDELNNLIAGSWHDLTAAERKRHVKETFIRRPDVLNQVLAAYEVDNGSAYDFENDRLGEVAWYRAAKKIVTEIPLNIAIDDAPTPERIFEVVLTICNQFKKLVEDNQLCKLLYDKDGRRKHESAAQLLFFGIAASYCEANDLALSPESDAGRGPVDFKIGTGFAGQMLVEVKLTSNSQLVHGFQKQLPIYQKAENAKRGVYLVIENDDYPKARQEAFERAILDAGANAPKVIRVDGVPRPSASRADL